MTDEPVDEADQGGNGKPCRNRQDKYTRHNQYPALQIPIPPNPVCSKIGTHSAAWMHERAKQTSRCAARSQMAGAFVGARTLVIPRRDRFPIRGTCPPVQLMRGVHPEYAVRVVI